MLVGKQWLRYEGKEKKYGEQKKKYLIHTSMEWNIERGFFLKHKLLDTLGAFSE